MIKLKKCLWTIIPLFLLLLAACGGEETAETPTATLAVPTVETPQATNTPAEPIFGEALIDSIQVITSESFPVQIEVRVRGQLQDGCTSLDEIITERNGNDFQVRITTVRPADQICTQATVPYEEVVPLDVSNLVAGTYTVSVNGVNGSFTLDANNVETAETPTPEAVAATPTTAAADGSITGRIWHDLCTIPQNDEQTTTATPAAATPAATATPAPGCVAAADGSFLANGLLEAGEPAIAGVTVSLGEGECPAAGLETAVTDENGDYLFANLPAGTYCVSVDPLNEENSETLLPGAWTFPQTNVNSVTLTVDGSQSITDVNFGWDYKFLPVPEVDPATCTNSIEYLEDLSIPDDSVYPPGAQFEKGWRLRNSGTCPWTTDYSLAYVGGDDPLGAPEFTPLESPVVPGQVVEVYITLTAPEITGTYRANFQISNADDQPFGINGFIGDAFWVQIVVEEGAPTPAPNSGSISGVVWRDSCRILASGAPSAGCVDLGGGFYRADGTFAANEVSIEGVVVTLSVNACSEDGSINPANILQTTSTDVDGNYTFTGLDAGTYCVAIDAFDPANVDLLIPGDWTFPAPGTGRLGVILIAGEQRTDVDFGWDDLD